MLAKRRQLLGFLFLICLLGASDRVFACPPGQYEQCFLGACVCLPEIGGAVGAASEHVKHELEAQAGGNPLEAWIIASHNTAIGTAGPMPRQIRQQLAGYIEDDVMNRAWFKVGDNGVLNLAGLTIAYGDRVFGNQIAAITLIDLIVFRDANDAYNNPALWAHELTHVKQYRDWGTHNFAISYVRDVGSVENPAYSVGNNFWNWRSSLPQSGSPGLPPGPIIQAGLPPGTIMQLCGCYGPTSTMIAPEPKCQNQNVQLQMCTGFCPNGGTPYGYVCQ